MFIVIIILFLLVLFYIYATKTFNYWKVRGVKYDKPVPIFGNNLKGFLMKKSISQVTEDLYWKYPEEKVVGFFRSNKPELIIRDPEIVKRVLLNDFTHLYRRGFNIHKTVIEPLHRNLFFADGDLWRLLRQHMTPTFTSGKLKAMFPLIVERAERLQTRLSISASQRKPIDARELMARFTTDFIGACGFGLDLDSLNEEDSEFRQIGQAIFNVGWQEVVVLGLKIIFPETFKHLKHTFRVEKRIMNLVKSIINKRNHEHSGRNDFIDLLLDCQKKGKVFVESLAKKNPDGTPEIVSMELTDDLIAAQVFIFFAAGFETSSSAASFTLHQLAHHPHEQAKVKNEIDEVLSKYNNKLCYDAIKEMTYLECAFKESMRIFPTVGFISRETARSYTFPELGVSIDEGVKLLISVQGLHKDPKYFPEPEEFRPSRFLPGEVETINKFVYLPFGGGPRACIGGRLGLMQSLAGLAAVLSMFDVAPAPGAPRHPRVNPRSAIIQAIQDGLPMIFTPKKSKAA